MIRILLSLVLILFLILTATAIWQHGYIGLFRFQFTNFAGIQVLTDLVIALALFILWMFQDAKKFNRNPWPWTIATMTTGSIAPMVYLLLYKTERIDKKH